MNQSQPDLNPSSILDLKAELSKKYESFKQAKLGQNSESHRRSLLRNKGSDTIKKEEKKVKICDLPKVSHEEQVALQKSRLALEAKAKLYDQITSNKILMDEEQKDLYLVDFDRKVLYESKNDSLKQFSEQTDLAADCTVKTNVSDIKRNKLFHIDSDSRKSEMESCKSVQDDNPGPKISSDSVHYQDVLQNEVRDHGTAYFAFSTDEAKRKEQMEELYSMRQETEDQRQAKQKLQKKRAAILQARLAKVCERRNINQSVIEKFASKEDVEEPNQCTAAQIDLVDIPLPEAVKKEDTEKKLPKIRPWDIGKTDLNINSSKRLKTQFEYAEERRSERHDEFAPPSWY